MSFTVTFWNDVMIFSESFSSLTDAQSAITDWMSEHVSDLPSSVIGWKLYDSDHTLIKSNEQA